LWSPSSAENGSDYYALMREPQRDDVVIHVNGGIIVGWSRVASPFVELTEGPPNPAQWAGRPSYYRVDLKEYREFPNSVAIGDFIDGNNAALIDELKSDQPKRYPFILYNGELRRAQGAYLTRCTPKLYGLIRSSAYGHDEQPPREKARYWAMALGEGGSLWDECQEKGIAAVGWDSLNNLTTYPDRDALLQALIEARGTPTPVPTNDALALFHTFIYRSATGCEYISVSSATAPARSVPRPSLSWIARRAHRVARIFSRSPASAYPSGTITIEA
jgi:hypothetical protein